MCRALQTTQGIYSHSGVEAGSSMAQATCWEDQVAAVGTQLEWTKAAESRVETLPGWPRLAVSRSFSQPALLQGPENPGEETSLAVWVGRKWCLRGRAQGDRAARSGPLPQAPRASSSSCPALPQGAAGPRQTPYTQSVFEIKK